MGFKGCFRRSSHDFPLKAASYAAPRREQDAWTRARRSDRKRPLGIVALWTGGSVDHLTDSCSMLGTIVIEADEINPVSNRILADEVPQEEQVDRS